MHWNHRASMNSINLLNLFDICEHWMPIGNRLEWRESEEETSCNKNNKELYRYWELDFMVSVKNLRNVYIMSREEEFADRASKDCLHLPLEHLNAVLRIAQ